MSGLLSALNAGKTSLLTNQKSIEIIGNNIANVNTEGYSRQEANLTQVPSVNFGDFFIGQGVTVSDVERDYNLFIARQLQEKTIDYGEEYGRSNPLTELERVFNVTEDNLAGEIDSFFDAWQELTANPSGQVERDIVLQRGQLLGESFRATYEELDTIQENINNELLARVDTLNEQLQEVARLNDRIQLVETNGQTANSARDERDLLIQNLSQTLGVQTYTDSQGMLAVQLPGGLPLVQGNIAMSLEAVTSGSSIDLQLRVGDTTVKPLGLNQLGGEFNGLLEMRDVFIEGLRENLDTLAVDLTSAVNDLHSTGYFVDPTTGLPATGQIFFEDLAGPPVVDNAARHVNVAFTDSSYVAAAGQATAAPGDNEMALQISDLETTHFVSGTTDTFDAYYSKIVSRVGIEASRNDTALGGADDAITQLQNLRDGFAGVSLEEEMIDLIQFQRGFESSAKFLSTIDEMMNALLQLKG